MFINRSYLIKKILWHGSLISLVILWCTTVYIFGLVLAIKSANTLLILAVAITPFFLKKAIPNKEELYNTEYDLNRSTAEDHLKNTFAYLTVRAKYLFCSIILGLLIATNLYVVFSSKSIIVIPIAFFLVPVIIIMICIFEGMYEELKDDIEEYKKSFLEEKDEKENEKI